MIKALIPLLVLLCTFSLCAEADERADAVIVAANPAGVSAAVAAARSGASVLLLEEHAHANGKLPLTLPGYGSQVIQIDAPK